MWFESTLRLNSVLNVHLCQRTDGGTDHGFERGAAQVQATNESMKPWYGGKAPGRGGTDGLGRNSVTSKRPYLARRAVHSLRRPVKGEPRSPFLRRKERSRASER
jgi:hypothetical protein